MNRLAERTSIFVVHFDIDVVNFVPESQHTTRAVAGSPCGGAPGMSDWTSSGPEGVDIDPMLHGDHGDGGHGHAPHGHGLLDLEVIAAARVGFGP